MKRILLASEHLDPRALASGELGAGVAFALTAGEGPSRNPKQQANEDSLAVLPVQGGFAGIVADAHWGAFAGEALVKAAVAALEERAPATHVELAELLLDLDGAFREGRPEGDTS